MRAALGIIVIDMPSSYASDAQDYLSKGLATRDELKHESLLSFCIAPHAPYTVSDKAFERIAMLQGVLDLPLHIHLHETRDEIGQSLARHGVRPLARLQKFGLVDANLIAVHAVHLTPQEASLLGAGGCHVAHCPSSNLKLASGIAAAAELLKAGVNVGLGTDGAASNHSQDLFDTMKAASLLQKVHHQDAGIIEPYAVLRMATAGGAKALGVDALCGTIEIGKRADLILLAVDDVHQQPVNDIFSQLVHCAKASDVRTVMVNGKVLLRDRKLLHHDEKQLIAQAREANRDLMKRVSELSF